MTSQEMVENRFHVGGHKKKLAVVNGATGVPNTGSTKHKSPDSFC